MATLPIHLEVEDIAVGPVLIALRRMPGVIKFHVDLGEGPQQPARQPGSPKGSTRERIIAMFMKHHGGPLQLNDIIRDLGIPKGSGASTMYKMQSDKIVKRVAIGSYVLSEQAKAHLMPNAPRMLPAPAKAANGKSKGKRAARGEGQAHLLALLKQGPRQREELIKALSGSGVKSNSVGGTLARAERDKLAKSNGKGLWELTDKGKQQIAAQGA